MDQELHTSLNVLFTFNFGSCLLCELVSYIFVLLTVFQTDAPDMGLLSNEERSEQLSPMSSHTLKLTCVVICFPCLIVLVPFRSLPRIVGHTNYPLPSFGPIRATHLPRGLWKLSIQAPDHLILLVCCYRQFVWML